MVAKLTKSHSRRTFPQAVKELGKQIKKHPILYLMILPALAYFVVFKYIPMYGILIGFKDFKATKGIWGSDWAGLKYFNLLFRDMAFRNAFVNTVIISMLKLVTSFLFSITLALLLNEFRSNKIKSAVQTVIYMPHFLTWVVIAGLLNNVFGTGNGVLNYLITSLGGEPVDILSNPNNFRALVVITNLIKEGGWGSIIYMAAITSISPELYEAARMDGANRWQQMRSITLPALLPTASIMLIMSLGNVMDGGFDQIFVLYNSAVMSVGDIIDTLIYRKSLIDINYSYGAAAGLLKSVIGLVLVVITNKVVKKMGQEGLY